MPMAFDKESVRMMLLNAQDQESAISDIAKMIGITEDEVKRITYDNLSKTYDWSKLDGIILSSDNENIKGWLNAVLDKLFAIGEWNTVDVRIQFDNSKGQYVEYVGSYGINEKWDVT